MITSSALCFAPLPLRLYDVLAHDMEYSIFPINMVAPCIVYSKKIACMHSKEVLIILTNYFLKTGQQNNFATGTKCLMATPKRLVASANCLVASAKCSDASTTCLRVATAKYLTGTAKSLVATSKLLVAVTIFNTLSQILLL